MFPRRRTERYRVPLKETRTANVSSDSTPRQDSIDAIDRLTVWRRRLKKYNRPSFDPFSIFKVKPQCCHILYVTVLIGRNISKGKLRDKEHHTPDPYLKGYVPESKSPLQRTSTCDNSKNPEWNEMFRFYINPDTTNTLRLELWEKNLVSDDLLDTLDYNLDLVPVGDPAKVTVTFSKKSCEVDIKLHIVPCTEPDVRYSVTLCDEEKTFVHDRKKKVLEAMKSFLGDKAPSDLRHVPVIAVMGSGGGFRACCGLSGTMAALHSSKILSTVTYLAGVSGSAWYLAYLYSHPDWPKVSPDELMEELQLRLSRSQSKALNPMVIGRFIRDRKAKTDRKQPVNFVDFYGHIVADIILKDQQRDTNLSDQKAKICDGNVPIPIYTSVRVKSNIPATEFHEWIEYSPYEISIPKYGVSIPPYLLNSRFYLGMLIDRFPETPLHFLMGIWGSFFAILLSRLKTQERNQNSTSGSSIEEPLMRSWSEDLSEASEEEDEDAPDSSQGFSEENEGEEVEEETTKTGILDRLLGAKPFNNRRGRAARVLNFLRGINFTQTQSFSPFTNNNDEVPEEPDERLCNDKSFYTVDAGLAVNLPVPPMLRPQRQVDLLLSFDFSHREDENDYPFKDLKEAEKWAQARGVPFPPINVTKEDIERDGIKECYVFKDEKNIHCPIVVHFVLINKSFKDHKRPGVKRETSQELEFGNFRVFNKDENTYSTFNIQYTYKAFARLFALTQYNVLNNVDVVKEAIIESISRRKRKQRNALSWELNRVMSVASGNIHRLLNKRDICTQSFKKMAAILSGDKGGGIMNPLEMLGLSVSQEEEVVTGEGDNMEEPEVQSKSCSSSPLGVRHGMEVIAGSGKLSTWCKTSATTKSVQNDQHVPTETAETTSKEKPLEHSACLGNRECIVL